MTTLDYMIINLIIITLLPIVAKAPVAFAMKKLGGGNIAGYDNKLPREQQKQLSGFGARCLAAHQNSFEALIMFTPALLLVIATDAVTSQTLMAATVFTLARIGYLLCYWFDVDKLRSVIWGVGVFCNLYLLAYCLS